jgi:hypothetical protein
MSSPPSPSGTATAATAATAVAVTSLHDDTVEAVKSIQESFHIDKLLNYLPIIVLVIIILISIVSSDLLKDNWSIFATLVIAFVWVTFVHYFSPTKYVKLKDENPPSTFLPKLTTSFDISSNWFLYIVVPILIFGLGLGLGFGSINVSNSGRNYDPREASVGMITVGSIMLAVGVLYFLSIGLKYSIFKDTFKWIIDKFNVLPLPLILVLLIIGIPLIVRGNEIKSDFDGKLNNDEYSSKEFQESLAKSGAETMLGIGTFFQIAVFIAVGYYLWKYTSTNESLAKPFLGIAVIIIVGALLISKSMGAPGFASSDNPFENKAFMVHAVIYLIVGLVFLVILFGQTEKLNVLKIGFGGLSVILIIMIIVAAIFQQIKNNEQIDMATLTNDNDSVYYKQLRDEAVKELKKTNPNATNADIEAAVSSRLDKLREKSQGPTDAIMWIFTVISLIIVACIGLFWVRRKTLISDSSIITSTVDKDKIKDDKMFSNDWDKLLTDNEGESMTIRLAKWFSFVPFLSVILLIMWVSILFTNVTTSPATTNWIGNTFSGDMFPRVKELIDTFFIVIIAGLSLCAILLLPVVKEMNAGGLESILKFAESVQVWQFNKNDSNPIRGGWVGLLTFIVVIVVGLSWWWDYLVRIKPEKEATTGVSLPIVPDNWGWAIAFVVLLAICAIPTGYNIWGGFHADFDKEIIVKRILRQFMTTIYLVPWLIIVLFRAGLYSVASLSGIPDIVKKRDETIDLLKFWKWDANETDLRMFPTDGNKPTPKSATSMPAAPASAAAPAGASAPVATDVGINETKVSAIGKLIKVILLTISFVILILAIIYYVYKIDAEFTNKRGDADATASGGFAAQMNSPTAHTIYVLIAIVGIAGLVAYLREKFTKANNKTPENYLFDDMKTEDATKPLRQLAFGATHIIYVILMVVVWIYDRDKDDKNLMSVTGMTVLGLAILFFHYGLEFIDTLNPNKNAAETGADVPKPSVTDIFTNIRFIINTVFFIALCALAYYKQHGVMVVLILAMFIFHLTKSIIGLKLLKLLWLGIIYIPCLFLDFLQSSQSAVGDTTRPIWIIVAIEILLIAILYGGPYLINYIGASASQMVAAPVSLKEKYDTNLNTQSPQIFIFHNTGIDRTPEDKAANCPVEEKKRYNYSISGWFILNNTVNTSNGDLEIFNFGNVPRLTYNTSTNELKLFCNTLNISGTPNTDKDSKIPIYNSKANYNTITSGKNIENEPRIKILLDNDDELDAPIPIQKWNYFVINYNGKTMDFFLNNKLIFKSDFIMPDIQLKPITVGDGDRTKRMKGLNGSICNFAFHKVPLTKEQIRWTYTMLKSQDPPMIGMPTIVDDVKQAGSTDIYSK